MLGQMLISVPMRKTSEKFQKFHSNVEGSMNKTPHLQQAIAQLEASLSRKENQKVTEKSQNT
tara:strand:- start:1370 stop:1555 length:186 start_codon:yes stop_codon:yes gene_type:complete